MAEAVLHTIEAFRAENTVHVWCAPRMTKLDTSCLSSEEDATATRFRFEDDRLCYRQTHAALRHALSALIPSCAPSTWRFGKGERDKPYLIDYNDFYFNISHSRTCYAISIGPRPLGIDIERLDRQIDYNRLLRTTTHPEERAWLPPDGASIKARSFLTIWTRKEALLKATGEGVARDLTTINTQPECVDSPCLIPHANARWHITTWGEGNSIISLVIQHLNSESSHESFNIVHHDAADLE